MILTNCLWCNGNIMPIEVHGHYQCPNCKINIDPCCSGEQEQTYDQTIQSCDTKRYDEWYI